MENPRQEENAATLSSWLRLSNTDAEGEDSRWGRQSVLCALNTYFIKNKTIWTSPAVRWLRLHPANAGVRGLRPHMQHSRKMASYSLNNFFTIPLSSHSFGSHQIYFIPSYKYIPFYKSQRGPYIQQQKSLHSLAEKEPLMVSY